jgi:hypothetical protein
MHCRRVWHEIGCHQSPIDFFISSLAQGMTSSDKNMEKQKCQSIFTNLLHAKAILQTSDASVQHLREWMTETERCDKFHNMFDVRANYARQIGPESMTRIIDFQENDIDIRKVNQAVMHLARKAINKCTQLFKLDSSPYNLSLGKIPYCCRCHVCDSCWLSCQCNLTMK